MATRQRTTRGRRSGGGDNTKPPGDNEEGNVTEIKFGSQRQETADTAPSETREKNGLHLLYEAARNLEVPFAAGPDFYYAHVAPLIHSYGYDWRLEEDGVAIIPAPAGGFLITYRVHLHDIGNNIHMKYDKVTISTPICEPMMTRAMADRAFMRSFLKLPEQPPVQEPMQGSMLAPASNIVPLSAVEEPSDDMVEPQTVIPKQPVEVNRDTTGQPVFEDNAEDDTTLVKWVPFIQSTLQQYLNTDCTNVDLLQNVWTKNDAILQRIKYVNPTSAKAIGKMFGDKQKQLTGG